MSKEETQKIFQYKFKSAVTIKFNYNLLKQPFSQMPLGNSNFNVNPKVGFSIVQNEATVQIDIVGTIKETNEQFIDASVIFTYEIKNLSDFLYTDDVKNTIKFKDVKLEEYFIPTIIGVSYSTMRSILLAKGAGTILQTEILPVIDPHTFLKPKTEKD